MGHQYDCYADRSSKNKCVRTYLSQKIINLGSSDLNNRGKIFTELWNTIMLFVI